MQVSGLEWFYRLSVEPSRLWRRYLLLNPLFASMLMMQAMRPRAFNPGHAIEPKREFLYG
jgi:UDP-N-acetyl-D-mannosaminuronic acid transferase (WecB/TagA/CpsF family)